MSDDLARTFSAADYMTFLPVYFFSGILTLAISIVIFRAAVLWSPLAVLGGLITVGGVASMFAPLKHNAQGVLT